MSKSPNLDARRWRSDAPGDPQAPSGSAAPEHEVPDETTGAKSPGEDSAVETFMFEVSAGRPAGASAVPADTVKLAKQRSEH
ncbi:MAG: hypothetical protein KDA44_00975, partial [Planctomycetales bacterium]|nr:hypothetical protein [Planctomycetales bacterium]